MSAEQPEFTHEIKILPSYDHRDDPNDHRGAGGAELVLILRGPLGAIVAKVNTGWVTRPLIGHYMPGLKRQNRRDKPGVDARLTDVYPSGAYVGSHSYVPRDNCTDANGPCDWLGGAVCYGDGSYTMADEILRLLIEQGSDAVFTRLEELYRSWIADRPVVMVGGAS